MVTMGTGMELETCKSQLECIAAMIEAITEGSGKLREAQRKAANEANAGARALRERAARAGDAQELWHIQSEWAQASFGAALAYWREIGAIAVATQSCVAKCAFQQVLPATAQAASRSGDPQRQLIETMDAAYMRLLESARQYYAPAAATAPQASQAA